LGNLQGKTSSKNEDFRTHSFKHADYYFWCEEEKEKRRERQRQGKARQGKERFVFFNSVRCCCMIDVHFVLCCVFFWQENEKKLCWCTFVVTKTVSFVFVVLLCLS
jgi:hypothetical protein